MPDIGPARLARGADQSGRHLHLVERLVPDVIEPVGRGHARPDAGIDEIEEEQAGETAGLRIRVYGEKGHIAWNQSRPDDLTLALPDGVRMLTRGGAGLAPAAKRATHMVAGLPEGFFDAFAVLYRDFADIIVARRSGGAADPLTRLAPTAADGVRGCAFVEAALASRQAGGGWVDLPAGV